MSIKTDLGFIVKFSRKSERKILKMFLLGHLNQLLHEIFQKKMQFTQNNVSMECYVMDSKIIQFLIHSIVETGEYTLEGIAYYTRIPFDVIYEAAYGISNEITITPWAKIVDLYIQVKPEVAQLLVSKLLEFNDKNHAAMLSLMNES